MDPEQLAERLEAYFSREEWGLAAVYLFGSFGRESSRPGSDVDLGLLFAEAPPRSSLSSPRARVEDDLEADLGRRVQAVVLNTAPPDLVHRVFRDGKLVHESDPSRRVAFEVASRREYLDLLPALRRYRRSGSLSR